MLAGLLFANHEAVDRPGALTATLPLGGTTLIEAQARVLVELGASQVVVLVARMTPELLGALGRIGRRGVAVDPVRSATEAAEKLHPLARVLVLADGLISSSGMIAPLAGEGGDALLVVESDAAPAGFERVGGNAAWAGVARLSPARLAEVAGLPHDYDVQSALVRVASQAKAAHMLLARGALADGHGIEHRAAAIGEHGRALLAASVAHRTAWFDRWLVAPLARRALPVLVEREAPTVALVVTAAALGLSGIGALLAAWPVLGLILLLAAVVPLALGATLARLREEDGFALGQEGAVAVLAAAGAVLLGRVLSTATGTASAVVIALALVLLAGLGERAALPRLRRRWWGTPAGYLALLAAFGLVRHPALGLALVALYAAATAAAAIEALRRQA